MHLSCPQKNMHRICIAILCTKYRHISIFVNLLIRVLNIILKMIRGEKHSFAESFAELIRNILYVLTCFLKTAIGFETIFGHSCNRES